MEINFDSLPTLVGLSLILFFIYISLYKRFIYSIIDPLFVWTLTTAFSSVLVLYVVPVAKDVLHFFGCQVALWIGFVIAYRQASSIRGEIKKHEPICKFSNHLILYWTTYFLLTVYIVSNIIIGYSKGFALLSDTPTESKIANFQEGFGLFRKINWSTGTFVTTALFYMVLVKKRTIDLFFLLISIFLSLLDGSKSALLSVVISIGIVFYHPVFSDKRVLLRKFQCYLPLVFVGVFGIFFAVLAKENDGIDETIFAFVRRLLYSADSILYFYLPVNVAYFDSYSSWDYLSRIINPILGFLRLQPYNEALGNIMVENLRSPGSTSTVTVGPNTPFYMDGRIYFYYWGAFPYSMFVGYTYAMIRNYYFSITSSSAFYLVYMGSVCRLAYALIIDVNLAVTQLFDLFFFVVPPYLIIYLLISQRFKIRFNPSIIKLHNSK